MYWLPFLERLVQDGVDRSRIIPITRGGAAAWYGCERGMEVYGMRSPQDVRIELRQRLASGSESVKQLTWTPFERQIVKDAAETLGLKDYLTLHPRWMYHVLSNYWEAQKGLVWFQERTAWSTLPAPALPDLKLPERFVAARFYLRPTFSQQATDMAKACIYQIAQSIPVVLCHHDLFLDDHRDLEITGPNIQNASDLTTITPENNLAVHSAIVAKSDAFVGTYGGFAMLALRMGKGSVSFYDDWNGTMLVHKHLADTISVVTQVPFLVVGMHDIPFLQSALPRMQIRQHIDAPVPQPA